MFGRFEKKCEIDLLHEKYKKLMKEAHQLSISDRKKSDEKVFEAEQVILEIENIYKQRTNRKS